MGPAAQRNILQGTITSRHASVHRHDVRDASEFAKAHEHLLRLLLRAALASSRVRLRAVLRTAQGQHTPCGQR